MNKLQHARKLAANGLSVFPIVKDQKTPAISWKEFQSRHATDDELIKWFSGDKHDIGIVTGKISGIVVIDTDCKEAYDAASQMGLLSCVNQPTPRGNHFVHRYDEQRNTTNLSGVKGLDVRGDGGYIKAYAGSAYWNLGLLNSVSAVIETNENKPTHSNTDKPTTQEQPSGVGYLVMKYIKGVFQYTTYHDECPKQFTPPKYGEGQYFTLNDGDYMVACVDAC